MELIDIKKIDPSLSSTGNSLARINSGSLPRASCVRGFIEPVVLRRCNGRFQVICGERRFRAVKEYTDIKSILARVIKVNDLEARCMCAAENLQREKLNHLFHKFMRQVGNIFNNLPKPLKWRSFYENDLPVLLDTSEDVLVTAIDHNLNRSQVGKAGWSCLG
ncbi:MAG: ParB N-terminal domain-containing protein [Desulfatiglans sp.]|jgi:hypothetical protein|nr:ParB N-terminal domain-containing protein [Desulfatiglans sp.]